MTRTRQLLAALGCVVSVGCSGDSPSASPEVTVSAGRSASPSAVASPVPSPSPSPLPSAPDAAPLAGRLIVIDPGHNRDNGRHPRETGRLVDAGGFRKPCNTTGSATNAGVPEAQIAWELAGRVRDGLVALGAEVLLTREHAGWGPCVDARATLANARGADLLLSVHADGAAAGAHGFHVITPGLRRGWTDDVVEPSAAAARAVRDGLVAAGLTPSTYLGERGIDVRTDLGTLNHADVPVVLVETGNLRNAGDARLLTMTAGQDRVAAGLVAGVRDFLAD